MEWLSQNQCWSSAVGHGSVIHGSGCLLTWNPSSQAQRPVMRSHTPWFEHSAYSAAHHITTTTPPSSCLTALDRSSSRPQGQPRCQAMPHSISCSAPSLCPPPPPAPSLFFDCPPAPSLPLTLDVGGDAVLQVAHHGPSFLARRHAVRLALERVQADHQPQSCHAVVVMTGHCLMRHSTMAPPGPIHCTIQHPPTLLLLLLHSPAPP